jgi:hypothetical protein
MILRNVVQIYQIVQCQPRRPQQILGRSQSAFILTTAVRYVNVIWYDETFSSLI